MNNLGRKKEIIKEILRSIHRGEDVETLKQKFRPVLKEISPFEIPLIEQELVKEGVPIREILKLCDLHVALFRETLMSRELQGVPEGHPLDLLMRENEKILKLAEALSMYATALLNISSTKGREDLVEGIRRAITNLYRSLRLHYRKNQMLLFPYLERRGIVAVPRVLWGREDQAITGMRQLYELVERREDEEEYYRLVAQRALEVVKEISELVFRENKILYPALWALLSEGEWVAIKEEGDKIGYIIDVSAEWSSKAKPVLPYEVEAVVTPEQMEKLPPEMRAAALRAGVEPDTYRLVRDDDLDLGTGFLSREEVRVLLNSLPLEITFADTNGRVRYYSKSRLLQGFTRTKTLLGRKVEFCHPPRLENLVRKVIDELRAGLKDHEVFWTRVHGRILRVTIVAIRDKEGRYLGAAEVVEDFTDILENPDKISEKIIVL